MAKVFSIHHFELHPGVDAAAFEQFVNEHVYPATVRPDLTLYVLSGDRGERKEKHIFMLEFASVEARDHYWPAEGVASEAGKAYVASWMKQW